MNKQLTPEQIDYLFEFCRKHYVQHYDLQVELVDHLASAIENRWAKQPDLSFEESLHSEFKQFGIYGFSKIKEIKQKELQKKYTRLYQRYFIDFFKLPKIILTIVITSILFFIFSHTNNGLKIGFNLVVIYLVFLIVYIFILFPKKLRLELIPGKSFLLHDYYKKIKWMSFAIAVAPLNILQSLNNLIRESGQQVNNWEIELLTAFLLALFFIGSIIMTVYIPQRIKEDFTREFPQFVKS
jgi:hypothetical protein